LTEHVPGVIFRLGKSSDGSYLFQSLSPATQSLFGLAPEAIRQDSTQFLRLLDAASAEEFSYSLNISEMTLLPWQWEGKVRLADGRVKCVHGRALAIKQEGGCVVWDGIFIDVTAKHQAEEDLKRHRFVMDQAADSVLWLDDGGRILYANRTFCDLFGLKPNGGPSDNIRAFAPNMSQAEWLGFFEAVRLKGTETLEQEWRSCSGKTIAVEVSLSFVLFNEQKMVCAFIRDRTEVRRTPLRLVKSA
jgi:PAS domain S-box-containing protein